MIRRTKTLWALSALLSTSATYVESASNELSDNYLAPTPFTVEAGANTITGTLAGNGGDLDMVQLIVPAGLRVTGLFLEAFSGGNNGSFLMMQPGATLSSPPSSTFADPVGFSILAPTGVGTDLLPSITFPSLPTLAPFYGASALEAGSYAVWLNETGAASSYTLRFEAVPEPSTGLLTIAALAALTSRRQRT